MQYVYIQSEPQLWTVGFYKPNGEWESDSDHSSKEDAAARVHYLNGGKDAPDEATSQDIERRKQWAGG